MPAILVLLCESLGEPPLSLDLPALRHWLEETEPDVHVDVVAELCRRPKELSRAKSVGAERLVLGLCSRDYSELEMQYRARKAGVDPLALERVNLGDFCALPHQGPQATDKAKLLLAAAMMRARAFLGSGPDDVKPYLLREHGKINRRALFTLPPIGYRPVASIVASRCVSEAGCEQCVGVCPTDALTSLDGRMTLDRHACVGCGICASECPRGAIHVPGHSRSQLDAEIAELLTNPALDAASPRAPLFLCQRNAAVLESVAGKGFTYPVGWLPVTLPCVGMLTVTMILRSFVLGAAAVGVLASSEGCGYGRGERVAGRLDYCREFLDAVGHYPADVRLLEPSEATSVLARELHRPFETATREEAETTQRASFSGALAAAEIHRALGTREGKLQSISVSHPHSPFGVIHVEDQICTGCGACSQTCPTQALTLEQERDSVSLVFDPTLCTGCGQCERRCPEQAISAEKMTDLETLAAGRVPLYEDRGERCESCGAVLGSSAMLRRVQELLSHDRDGGRTAVSTIGRFCPSCRLIGIRQQGQ